MRPRLLTAPRREPHDTLVFAPLAWLKLMWFCHAGNTEVGGFGISAEHNPLYVEDFVSVRQRASMASVHLDDAAVADLFDAFVDRGLQPDRFARIWIHTHPGLSPEPSETDETTFTRSFGGCDWAVMFIVSRTSDTYARLRFTAGPGGELFLPTAVAWSTWPAAAATGGLDAELARWQNEFAAHVEAIPPISLWPEPIPAEPPAATLDWWDAEPWSDELDGMFFEPVVPGGHHAALS